MKTQNNGAGESAPPRRILYVMRHAAAEFEAASDFDRPLSVLGRKQANAVGARMLKDGQIPEHIFCSAALRTRITKDLLLAQWGSLAQETRVTVLPELYEVPPREVLSILRSEDATTASILLIGHEPTVSMLTALLAHPGSDQGALKLAQVGFMTAAVAELEFEKSWEDLGPASGQLLAIQPPPSQ